MSGATTTAPALDEATFDRLAHNELQHIEQAFADIDPDQVDVSVSDGVLRLDLRDGTKIVINSHRAARQIWMAAIATAWHFDPPPHSLDGSAARPAGVIEPTSQGPWVAAKTGDELRATIVRLVRERVGVDVAV